MYVHTYIHIWYTHQMMALGKRGSKKRPNEAAAAAQEPSIAMMCSHYTEVQPTLSKGLNL